MPTFIGLNEAPYNGFSSIGLVQDVSSIPLFSLWWRAFAMLSTMVGVQGVPVTGCQCAGVEKNE